LETLGSKLEWMVYTTQQTPILYYSADSTHTVNLGSTTLSLATVLGNS